MVSVVIVGGALAVALLLLVAVLENSRTGSRGRMATADGSPMTYSDGGDAGCDSGSDGGCDGGGSGGGGGGSD